MKRRFPKVFIIILTYNNKSEYFACLESLKKLDYPNFEVLIIDNASKDGTASLIKKDFPFFKLIENKRNLGFAKGNNLGIKYALKRGAEWICLLNSDTVVKSDFLQKMFQVALKENADLLGPKILYHKSDLIWAAGGQVNLLTGVTKHLFGGKKSASVPQREYQADYLPFCAVLIKSEVFRKIGFIDPDYFLLFEDTDFCLRAKRAGFKLLVVPSAIIWHRVSSSFKGTHSPLYLYYFTRNKILFMRKNAPIFFWFIFFWSFWLLFFKEMFIILYKQFNFPEKEERLSAMWRGLIDGLLNKVGRK